ncbi:LOW QUALITY PROTEIN: neogenin-like [Penaeus chinensis]|uniref:LOW QUALITY PROTEIN: neogenin-like n=1 Tax=Penaeus chinensis TaxID=139456 RepID=UPI001FB6B015|nr:LOW QUALITY PROTEIN: neogenin-like [Penaeus chinensis]
MEATPQRNGFWKDNYGNWDPSLAQASSSSSSSVSSSSLSVSVSWFKDSQPLEVDSRMTLLPSGALEIENVVSSDEGEYYCHASSFDKTKVSHTATLRVKAAFALRDPMAPAFIATPPPSLVARVGDVATLDCAANGYPEPVVVWLKDGATIDMAHLDTRFHFLGTTRSLQITPLKEEDSGAYMCRAENREDSVDAVAHLEVLVPPRFVHEPTNAVGYEKEDLELECQAYGRPPPPRPLAQECRVDRREQLLPGNYARPTAGPPPLVRWLKNAELIVESNYFQMVNGQNLKILGLVEGDAGMYQCVASNAAGSAQASAQLRVLKSNIPDSRTHKTTETTEREEEEEDRGIGIGIGVFEETTGGRGRDEEEEDEDEDEDEGTELLPDQPSSPRRLQAIIASNRFITLAWHEPRINNEHIVGYSVFYRQEGSLRERVQNVSASSSSEGLDEYKTQIGQLSPGTEYLVRVVAHSSRGGPGLSSREVRVSTKPDLDLPPAPQGLRVTPLSPRSLEVVWEGQLPGSPSPPAPPSSSSGLLGPPGLAGGGEEAKKRKKLEEEEEEKRRRRKEKTPVTGYVMYYMQVGSAEEHEVEVSPTATRHDLEGLDEFTEYSVWLVAVNANGAGDATREVTARTFSDVPTREPQNVTVEAASSRSLILRWEPPPPQDQNGVITGYKIRYKERGKAGSTKTKTTDGNRRLFALTDLKRSTQYSIKLSALTVNGSGPSTHWIPAETFANDLDENRVPDKPTSLRALAMKDHISVKWQPPQMQNVMVRGYTIGWGKGIPDVYSKIVDSKQRSYVIEGLEPNAEYVISLRAFNSVGETQAPCYEQVRTRPPEPPSAPTLTPPVGLKAEVLTPFTVALQWTDTTLNRNQVWVGSKIYIETLNSILILHTFITHTPYHTHTHTLTHTMPNSLTSLSLSLFRTGSPRISVEPGDLQHHPPGPPPPPPRDITVVPIPGEPHTIVFNWQPPKQANGKITGYLIFYTTDANGDWVMEEVKGDRMTFRVHGLTPTTLYYYKMQARNVKGFGPLSGVGNFTTMVAGLDRATALPPTPGWFLDQSSLIVLAVAGVGGALTVLGALVGLAFYCRRNKPMPRHGNLSHRGAGKSGTGLGGSSLGSSGGGGGGGQPELKPPDLWIHHDHHLEMKNLDKGDDRGGRDGRGGMSSSEPTADSPRTPYQSTYLLVGGSTSSSVYSEGPHSLHRPGYSLAPFAPPSSVGGLGGLGGVGGGGPPSTSSPAENPYSPNPTSLAAMLGGPSVGGPALPPPPPLLGSTLGSNCSQYSSTLPDAGVGGGGGGGGGSGGSSTLGKRSGNPLRSFSVPAPPQSAPTTPQPKHMVGMRPPGSGVTSPFKKPPLVPPPSGSGGRWGPGGAGGGGGPVRVDALPEHEEASEALLHGYSTEELSQEMANLEGLMKDLSAITANQFNC